MNINSDRFKEICKIAKNEDIYGNIVFEELRKNRNNPINLSNVVQIIAKNASDPNVIIAAHEFASSRMDKDKYRNMLYGIFQSIIKNNNLNPRNSTDIFDRICIFFVFNPPTDINDLINRYRQYAQDAENNGKNMLANYIRARIIMIQRRHLNNFGKRKSRRSKRRSRKYML